MEKKEVEVDQVRISVELAQQSSDTQMATVESAVVLLT